MCKKTPPFITKIILYYFFFDKYLLNHFRIWKKYSFIALIRGNKNIRHTPANPLFHYMARSSSGVPFLTLWTRYENVWLLTLSSGWIQANIYIKQITIDIISTLKDFLKKYTIQTTASIWFLFYMFICCINLITAFIFVNNILLWCCFIIVLYMLLCKYVLIQRAPRKISLG